MSARNVLLDENLNVKIADFGKSRRIRADYLNLYVGVEGPQPTLWMAVEALENREVSLNSDTWSFGVTVWEIFSLGEHPYLEMIFQRDSLLNSLKAGYRMSQPGRCPNRQRHTTSG